MRERRPIPAGLFAVDELASRPARRDSMDRKGAALQDLALRAVANPADTLPHFVQLALRLTGGSSAGLSMLDDDAGQSVFRWKHLAGVLAVFEGTVVPRESSPCGTTLDRNEVVLCRHPERVYDWIAEARIGLPEVLLVPVVEGVNPIGTLWVTADQEDHFNQGDAIILSELAAFAGAALHRIGRA